MKKLLIIFTAIAFAVPTFASGADFIDEQVGRVAPPDTTAGWVGAHVDDANTLVMPSVMYAGQDSNIRSGQGMVCSGVDDPACSSQQSTTFIAFLPQCATTIQEDCVEGFSAIKPDGTEVQGKFGSFFPKQTEPVFKGDPDKGVPNAWQPSIWTFDGVTHKGGNEFLLAPEVVVYAHKTSRLYEYQQLMVNIYPISRVATTEKQNLYTNRDGKKQGGRIRTDACPLWLGELECATPWAFPDQYRFKVIVRTSAPMSGWVHGRLDKPDVTVESFGAKKSFGQTGMRVSITAGASKVPVFSIWKRFTDLPTSFRKFLNDLDSPQKGVLYPPAGVTNWQDVWNGEGVAPYTRLSVEHDLDNFNSSTFDEFTQWLGVSDNKAIANKSQWAYYTNNFDEDTAQRGINKCTNTGASIAGIVTTNATMYIANPPIFNTVTQTLDYKVSSPHFDRNGVPNIGTYDLIINSEVARCIYGFTAAPVQASVSIINADGTTQVATSVLRESNGWLHLNAAGFGYSAPTIKVKLSQDAPKAEASPTPIPAETPKTAPAKTTITCVKGKAIKKVTAVKPTCPSGYKKKA
jgi:hypothetical protein